MLKKSYEVQKKSWMTSCLHISTLKCMNLPSRTGAKSYSKLETQNSKKLNKNIHKHHTDQHHVDSTFGFKTKINFI